MIGFPSPGNLLSAPKDWTRVRFKFAVDYINEKVDFEGDGEYVALENISSWTSLRLTSEAPLEPSSQTNRFQSGDVLFGKLRPYLAKVLLANFDGYASSECLVPRSKAVLPAFVRYWCLSKDFIELVDGSTFGSKMPRADWDFIGNTFALIPPLPVQRAIAAHLDRETAKIDTLIAKKRELIAKLKEQRSALISRTVTRGLPPEAAQAAQAAGLDPNPPMKDSGVEWLGEVPGHWNFTKFSRGVYIEQGQVDPEDSEYRDSIMIAPNHIESGTGRLIATETADEQGAISGKYRCEAGDVVYSKIRPALRKVVIVENDCLCSADMYPFRPASCIAARYLWYFLLTDQFTAWAKLESDRVAMPKINRESINQAQIPTPSMAEQIAIGSYLIEQTGRLDALLGWVETAITRLTEYRAALITAAVAGQLAIASVR